MDEKRHEKGVPRHRREGQNDTPVGGRTVEFRGGKRGTLTVRYKRSTDSEDLDFVSPLRRIPGRRLGGVGYVAKRSYLHFILELM